MLDREMIGYRLYRLCDRDIQGDISTHRVILQALAPGFWKILTVPVIVCHVAMFYVIVISQVGVGYHYYYTRPRAKPEVEC